MSKNCCAPVPTEQKRLLKVLTCLYENYILNQTPSTDNYFTNPTSENYTTMNTELTAINTLINNYITTNNIFVDISGNSVANVYLWTASAQGKIAFDSYTPTVNTYQNAIAGAILIDNNSIRNVGVLKTVQKLNIDECAEKTYQVTPVTYSSNIYTQATLVERVGCPGVSNLGFLGIYIQVPIEYAPFNNCYVALC